MNDSGIAQLLAASAPVAFWVCLAAAVVLLIITPMPGRGPRVSNGRDSRRGFEFEDRRVVMSRAGNQCESARFLLWGRCRQIAVEADPVIPWSKGGPTVVSNGQAHCRDHNWQKSSLIPPWWYVLCLEIRRRRYFPEGVDVKVRNTPKRGQRKSQDATRSRGHARVNGGVRRAH